MLLDDSNQVPTGHNKGCDRRVNDRFWIIVQTINELADHVLLHTPSGAIIADTIVYATGYLAGDYLDSPKANLNSTYAVTSQPDLVVDGWPNDCLIWETARPYFYA